MRLLVVGASGLVGGHVLTAATQAGDDALGVARQASGVVRACAMEDLATMERLLRDFAPEVVLCSAGFTWADGCEADPARSRRENFENPVALATLCRRLGIRFAYYSSSYVFDGRDGAYAESAPLSPLNAYGRDKAAAEVRLAEVTDGEALILRLIHVWGAETKGKNFAYQIRQANLNAAEVVASRVHLGNPTWAGDIAEWSLALCRARQRGVWHLAGESPRLSRREWAEEILSGLSRLGQPLRARLIDGAASATPRPLSAGLDAAKIQAFAPRQTRKPADLPPAFA
jgi:dTDP-4-dehydrorhamnose reductase